MMPHPSRPKYLPHLLLVIAMASGCQPISPRNTTSTQARNNLPNEQRSAAPAGVVYTIVFRSASGKIDRVQVQGEEMMTVQDALERARAAKRYSQMKIDVIRRNAQTGQKIKMGVDYLGSKHQIAAHTNYVLHPGDYIQVAEDTSSELDSFFIPLGRALGG